MTTFKELDTNIKLYMGELDIEIEKLTAISKVLYGDNKIKYTSLVKTFTDIGEDLKTFVQPSNLDRRILDSLSYELYLQRPEQYKTRVIKLENFVRQKKNYNLGVQLTLNLLNYSEYKDPSIINNCLTNYSTFQICDASISQDQKVKLLESIYDSTQSWNIPGLVFTLAHTISTKQLDDVHQLKLVHALIHKYPRIHKISATQRGYFNQIIERINICNETEIDLIKLLMTPKLLNKQNLAKITGLYPAGNFKSILKTAQALGLENNPDYWVQSLPSQQKLNIDSQVELPVFE